MPVIFRLWQEPNGPHNPYYGAWQGGLGTGGEAAFAAAWRHVWTVFNAEKATLAAGGNCIWVFCAQQTTGPAKTGGPWQPYWPGGDVVDWSGMDLYRETFPFEAVNPPVYGSFYQWAVDNQKPFMICESGFQQGKVVADSSGRYDKDGSVTGNSLITATRTAVKQYPQCVAYGIWNNGRGTLADFVDTSARLAGPVPRVCAATPGSRSRAREPRGLLSLYIWPGGVGTSHAPGQDSPGTIRTCGSACVACAPSGR